jgi:hypothetical protein
MASNLTPAGFRVPSLPGPRALLARVALGALAALGAVGALGTVLPAAAPPLQIHNASQGRWVLQSVADVAGAYTVTYQDRDGACTGVSTFDPAELTGFAPSRRLLIQLLPGESARIDHDGNASLDLRLVDADGRELPQGPAAGDLRYQITLPAPGDAPLPVGARWRVTNMAALALLRETWRPAGSPCSGTGCRRPSRKLRTPLPPMRPRPPLLLRLSSRSGNHSPPGRTAFPAEASRQSA